MKDIGVALIIGIIAGIIDATPMLIQKMDKFACLSAFLHWIFLGLIIPFVNWGIQPWLTGLIIGLLAAIPVITMIYKQGKKAAIPILFMSAVLGIGVAVVADRLIG